MVVIVSGGSYFRRGLLSGVLFSVIRLFQDCVHRSFDRVSSKACRIVVAWCLKLVGCLFSTLLRLVGIRC